MNRQSPFKSDARFSNLKREGNEAMLNVNFIRGTKVYQEAKEEGRLESQVKLVPKLLQKGLSIQEVADILELDIEEVRKAAQKQ